jgi:hypothetical protein
MGMGLFYVTGFEFFFWWVVRVTRGGFAVSLEGVCRKSACQGVVFAGEFVVNGVRNVG